MGRWTGSRRRGRVQQSCPLSGCSENTPDLSLVRSLDNPFQALPLLPTVWQLVLCANLTRPQVSRHLAKDDSGVREGVCG